jgi:hypothetical protein
MGLISPYFELVTLRGFSNCPKNFGQMREKKNWHPGEFVRNAFQDAPKKTKSAVWEFRADYID